MIKSTRQIALMRMGLPDTPRNFGGSESSSQANTTTTNNVNNIDRRLVGEGEAMGNTGDNSTLTRITQTTANFTDNSNRSVNFSDSSVKNTTTNTTTNVTTTDFGSVGAALSGMGQTASLALNNANETVSGAINLLRLASSNGLDMLGTVLDFAAGGQQKSEENFAAAIGFAQNTIGQASQAFAQASESQDNKSLKIAAIAIVAVAAAFAFKK